MKRMTSVVLVMMWSGLVLARATPPAVAPFEILTPVMGNSGCAGDTATAQIMRDDNLIKFSFSAFNVQAGGPNSELARKSCAITVPLKVNPGYSVAAPVVELKGFHTLTDGANSSFDIESFFAGQQGPHYKREFNQSGDFKLNSDTTESWSPCGEAVSMRVNISVIVKNPASVTPSTTAVEKGTILPLRWKRC